MSIINRTKIGAHYVRFRSSEILGVNLVDEQRRRLLGGMLSYSDDFVNIYFEGVTGEKYDIDWNANSDYATSDDIRLLYGAVVGYVSDFTLSTEWKNYRDFEFSDTAQKLYHNPPTLRYQHTSRLFGRHLYQENLLEETGFNIEGSYSPSYASTFTANYTLINKRDFDAELDEEKKLFEEMFVKAEHEFSDALSLHSMFGQNEHVKGTFTGGWLQGDYYFESGLTFSLTQELVKDDDHDVMENYTALTIAPNSKWSVTLSLEGTDEEGAADRAERMFGDGLGFDGWLAVDVNYRLNDTNLLRLFVGERREGLNCNGSICTYKPAFSGLEVQLISTF